MDLGGVLGLLFVILAAGIILWGVMQLPIDAQIKALVRVVVIVVIALVVLWFIFSLIGAVSPPTLRLR